MSYSIIHAQSNAMDENSLKDFQCCVLLFGPKKKKRAMISPLKEKDGDMSCPIYQ